MESEEEKEKMKRKCGEDIFSSNIISVEVFRFSRGFFFDGLIIQKEGLKLVICCCCFFRCSC